MIWLREKEEEFAIGGKLLAVAAPSSLEKCGFNEMLESFETKVEL